jgi:hypothetical protein
MRLEFDNGDAQVVRPELAPGGEDPVAVAAGQRESFRLYRRVCRNIQVADDDDVTVRLDSVQPRSMFEQQFQRG